MKTLLIACSTVALMAAPNAFAAAQETAADDGRHAGNYTQDHPWVGLPVRGVNNERLGSVSFVREDDGADSMAGMDPEADTEVETLVIETGGFLGFGDREVELDASQARLEVDDDDEYVRLAMDEDDLEALPEIDTDDFDDEDGLFDGNDDTVQDPEDPSP